MINLLQVRTNKKSISFALTLLLLTPVVFVYAQDGLVPCNGLDCTISDLFILLQKIYNFLLGLAAFVTLAFLLWGGVQMFSPSPNTVENGKKTVTYAIIGLAIIIASYLIVNTLIIVLSGNATNIGNLLNPLQ